MPLFDGDFGPLAGKLEIALIDPPDVLAAFVQQFELEIIHRRLGSEVEGEFIIGRQWHGELLADATVASARDEIKINFQTLARIAFGNGGFDFHAVGGEGEPCSGGFEVVEKFGLRK